MINPADIQVDGLPSVALADRNKLPTGAGIYFAIDSQGVVQYIGKANSIFGRWQQHHRTRQLEKTGQCRIAWLECPKGLLRIELITGHKLFVSPRMMHWEITSPH